jgi:glycosyltransferase involved in cell wall biosynthesis
MNRTISVCVVIPAHNAADTLARAIDSVLAQTRPVSEIVVVDDASTDDTAAVARTFRAQGVMLVSLHERRGAAGARNAGIAAAGSDWVAFLDADDEWLPAKLERQVEAISRQSDASLVFCASEEFLSDGRSLGDTFRGGPVSTGENAWKALLRTNFVATPTVAAPRALLLRLGGFDESLEVGEDQDMWIRLALAGQLIYVPERLARVHVRPTSLSAYRAADQSRHMLPMIERHVRQQGSRLTKAEVRGILGERLGNAGRIAFAHGDLRRGAAFALRAALLGHRPLGAFALIVKAPVTALFKWAGPPHRRTAL